MKSVVLASLLAAACMSVAAVGLSTSDADADRIYSLPDHGPLKSANYGGYVDSLPDTQAYYWLIESQSNPATDPVALWLTGGPGCSSLMALFTEMGPYTFRNGGELADNPFTWVTNATVIWIDSPGGVGYSTDAQNRLWTDDLTSAYNYAALKNILKRHSRFQNNKFFLTGESYAGHYIPQLAERIFDGDDLILKANMQGWMVGNPCTGDIGCNNPDPTMEPFWQYHGFHPLDSSIPTQTANFDPYDILVSTCTIKQELEMTHRFTKDLPHFAAARARVNDPPAPYGPCAQDYLTTYLNRADVKAAVHAQPAIVYSCCSTTLRYDFNIKGTVPIYQRLMNNTNWHIMIYSGTADSIVNFVQTETIVSGMGRPLKFNEYRAWNYPDVYYPKSTQLGGFYLTFDRITWATVRNSGHMVPQYNPPAGHEIFLSFITVGGPGRM